MPERRRGLTVGLLTVVTAVAFEATAVLAAMPAAVADLGHEEWYAWAFTAFVIAQIIAIVTTGRLCDAGGPARPFAAGLALIAVGVCLAGVAPTMAWLLVARFVQGIGAGMTNVALMVVAALAYSERRRATIMTWFSVAWMLPSFVGPAVAAWLTTTLSWRWVFWAVLPFLLAGGALVAPGVRKLPAADEDSARRLGPLLASAAGVAFGVTMIQVAGQTLTWWTPWLALLGLILLVVFARRLLPTSRPLTAVTAVRLFSAGSFFGVQAFLPLMLVTQRSLDLLVAGASITVASTGWLVGSWLQSRPWLRLRRDHIIVVGAGCVTAGLAIVAAGAWFVAWPVAVPVLGICVAGVGMGLLAASTTIATMQLSPPADLGHNTSALQVGEALGASLLTGLAGTLYAWWHTAGDLTLEFSAPALAMTGTSLFAIAAAFHIGLVENQSIR